MGTKKVMKLVNPHTREMVCQVCEARHWASIRPASGGHYYRGSWQCVNGCKLEDAELEFQKRLSNSIDELKKCLREKARLESESHHDKGAGPQPA